MSSKSDKKKSLVPRLRFPEFREAGAWEVKKISEVFRVTRGQVLATSLISECPSTETPYPVYSSQTKNGGLLGYYSDFLYRDSITWTTDGANAGDVKFRKGKFYCTNVCGILINEEGYANTFVAELLNSVTKKHVSYVGNPKLMNGVMGQIEIPLPKIEEQQKIADCLSSLDELIRAEDARLEALQAHKKGLMQQLFPVEGETTPRLRFPEFRNAGPWEVKRLGDKSIAKFIRDRVPSEEIPVGHYVSTVNLLPDFGGLATEPETPPPNNAIAYREGDILMSNIRPYLKKTWIADRSGGASNDVLVARAGKGIKGSYLGYLLMSDRFITYVMGGAKGVKMPRGDLEQIQDFRVPVPPKPEEQQKIADCLSSLDDLIRAQGERIEALKQHKKGLMQQLFPQEVA